MDATGKRKQIKHMLKNKSTPARGGNPMMREAMIKAMKKHHELPVADRPEVVEDYNYNSHLKVTGENP